MEQRFLPCIFPWRLRFKLYTGNPRDRRERIYSWLNKADQETYHPGALVSYEYRDAYQGIVTRELGMVGVETNNLEPIIFGDSGGFGLAQGRLNTDGPTVMGWQMKYSTRGAILDWPPYKILGGTGVAATANVLFKENLAKTVGSVQRALPYYERGRKHGTRFRWWSVLHGQSEAQTTKWFDSIRAVYPFTDEGEGWCIAAKEKNRMRAITKHMRFLLDRGVQRMHLLQVTSWRDLGAAFALAHLDGNVQELTYDSATATILGRNMGVLVPEPTQDAPWAFGSRDLRKGEFDWECTCAGCRWAKEDTGLTKQQLTKLDFTKATHSKQARNGNKWRSPFVWYLMMHNVLTMVKAFDLLWEQVQLYPRSVLKTCAGKKYGQVLRQWYPEHSHDSVRKQARVKQLHTPTIQDILRGSHG